MDIKPEDIVKGIVTFVVGVATANAGKLLDWWKGQKRESAETGKITTEMLLSMLKGTKELNDTLMDYNDKIVKESHNKDNMLRDKEVTIKTLTESNYEKDQQITQLKIDYQKCQGELKRVAPDDRGGRDRTRPGP